MADPRRPSVSAVTTDEDERESFDFPESTRAAIKANVEKWAATPIPDHIILKTRKIWNSVK